MQIDRKQGEPAETIEMLRSEIFDLKNRIFRHNLANNIDKLPLTPLPVETSDFLEKIPEVVVRELSLSDEEQGKLPSLRRSYGGNIQGNITISSTGRLPEEDPDLTSTLEYYAFITMPEFRALEDNYWQRRYEDESNGNKRIDHYNAWKKEANEFVEKHEPELLKGLKGDLEITLARIMPSPTQDIAWWG